jgi:hypothetical protein
LGSEEVEMSRGSERERGSGLVLRWREEHTLAATATGMCDEEAVWEVT